MRIALNAWFYDQPNTGSGQYTRNLVGALRALSGSLDIQLVTPRKRSDLAKVWFEQVEFPRAAGKMRADIAFVPYWAPPLQCDIPVAVTVHDVIPVALPEYRGGVPQRLYTALVQAASANVAAILTDSEFSRNDIVKRLRINHACVTTVPLAADNRFMPSQPDTDVARVRERYNLPESFVLYLGGFDKRKNIETLLQVYGWCAPVIGEQFPLLLNGDPDTPVYATDGRLMTLGQMMRELDLSTDDVRLIGRVAEEDKPALYASARCFIFTSLYEGFGLPVLEAMASGTPVVGSNASSIPEVVGNAGMLVDPLDARRMAGSVIAICTEDLLYERLRQRSLLRASQYSWQRTALETLAVFNRMGTHGTAQGV
ncbi:MAG: glycosyltransferase family 4 protein [Chloroflexi bacterium]|nr:glycosyltransferase family 4 protein [Chloroflexota bacterium]MCL5273833.1 glycosyltransferase family 4 protein [Chloroflexota bacterium]